MDIPKTCGHIADMPSMLLVLSFMKLLVKYCHIDKVHDYVAHYKMCSQFRQIIYREPGACDINVVI